MCGFISVRGMGDSGGGEKTKGGEGIGGWRDTVHPCEIERRRVSELGRARSREGV